MLVRVVEEGSPAATAGLSEGDLIVAVNGTAVTTADDLFDVMDTADEVRVSVVRGTDELEITVPLSAGG